MLVQYVKGVTRVAYLTGGDMGNMCDIDDRDTWVTGDDMGVRGDKGDMGDRVDMGDIRDRGDMSDRG